MVARSDVKQRFEDKYIPEPNTGCWLWEGALESSGYGQITERSNGSQKNHMAHRLSYEIYKGPLIKGMVVMHTCDMPSCVNPAHLKQATQKENMEDRDKKGRRVAPSGANHWRNRNGN